MSPADLGIDRLFEHTRDAVIVGDTNTGRIVLWNPAAEKFFGYSADDAVGLPIDVLVPDPLKSRHRAGLAGYRRHGHGPLIDAGEPIEVPACRQSGDEIWVELSLSPIEPDGGNGRYVLAIVRDATSRRQAEADKLERVRAEIGQEQARRAEAELRQAYAQLERRVEDRTRQITTLLDVGRALASTHELRPLLTSLLEHLSQVVENDGATILLQEGDQLCYAAVDGPDRSEEARHVCHPIARFEEAWDQLRQDQPIVVGDVRDESRDARIVGSLVAEESGLEFIGSLIWVPLVVKGQIIGLLRIARQTRHSFAARDVELALAIARQAAVAIENAHLHERAREAAMLEERQRLARELHDSVTQGLYSLKLYSEAASRQLRAGHIATVGEHLDEIRTTARETLGEMRLLLFELHPPPMENTSLAAALRARLSAVEVRSGLITDAQLDQDVRLAESVEREIYQIAQEALNNALRHARATRVSVVLARLERSVRLEVADDGIGFNLDLPSAGLGLRGMHERASRVGGTFNVESDRNTGTRVWLEVPNDGGAAQSFG